MFCLSHHKRSSGFRALSISLFTCWLVLHAAGAKAPAAWQTQSGATPFAGTLDLISRQRYNEAITRLEQLLEKDPRNGEALTYLATAHLYESLDFTRAQKDFKEAFQAGGGATFFVTHSHEKFNTGDVVDYCRGWLNLRAGGVEFIPIDGAHGFKFTYNQVEEFKVNGLSKKVFHIKVDQKSQNFRGRSNSDVEPLLIVALYKSFARS